MGLRDVDIEAYIRLMEVGLEMEKEKTRVAEENLSADRDAVEAKETERSRLLKEKNKKLAGIEAGRKLVVDFLEADAKKNFDHQKAMKGNIVAAMTSHSGFEKAMEAIEALATNCSGDGKKNLDELISMLDAMASMTNGSGETDSKASGFGDLYGGQEGIINYNNPENTQNPDDIEEGAVMSTT